MTPEPGTAGTRPGWVLVALTALTGLGLAGALLDPAAGAAGLLAVAAAAMTTVVASLAAGRRLARLAAAHRPPGPAPTRWRERAHRLWVPRTCDPDAAGQRRPRAPSSLAPVA